MLRLSQMDQHLLAAYSSQSGLPFSSLSNEGSVLLVFLRHFGCTFCRESVSDLASRRAAIEAAGARLAFVHLGTEEKAQWFFTPYKLTDVPRFADPQGSLYQAFGLVRADFRQFLKWESIARMLAAWTHGHFLGLPAGDIERMPGVFLLQRGEVRKSFRHKLVSDRPDYLALATAA